MGGRKMDWTTVSAHIFWVGVWSVFYLMWGNWFWTTAEFGSPEWMRDNYGHALAGFAIAWNGIYEIRLFFPNYYLCHRRTVLYLMAPFLVLLAATVWEFREALLDANSSTIRAQMGGPDTTYDIVITLLAGLVGIFFYRLYDRFTSNPDEVKKQEFLARAEALSEEKKHLNRTLRALRRDDIKEIPKKILDLLTRSSDDEDS